jgi:hypothetical protein
MSEERIVLEDWERVLGDAVPADKQAVWREAVVKFRYWLRETGRAPTGEAFRAHLAWKKSYLPPARYEERRQALRWYWEKGVKRRVQGSGVGVQAEQHPAPPDPRVGFQEAGTPESRQARRAEPHPDVSRAGNRNESTGSRLDFAREMTDVPTNGAADLGGPAWEQKMARCIRTRHLAWKTETTCRHWARRWMRFVEYSGVKSQRSGVGTKDGPDSPTTQGRGGPGHLISARAAIGAAEGRGAPCRGATS